VDGGLWAASDDATMQLIAASRVCEANRTI
jgi:hypothetical protein